MEKIKCYPKIGSLTFVALLILSLISGIAIFVLFREQGDVIFRVIWVVIILFCILFSIYGIFHFSQYLCIEDNKLILKSFLFTILVLRVDECYYEVSKLKSFYYRTMTSENWICIYSIGETKKFKYGFSNNKKFKRIQIIYNEHNIKFVEKCVRKHSFSERVIENENLGKN